MPDLESVRSLYPEASPASAEVRRRARLVLVEHIGHRSRRRTWWSRKHALAGVGLAVAAAAVAVALVGVGNEPRVDDAAAAVLRDAARQARAQEPLPPLGEGRVLYVKSVDAYLSTYPERGYALLEPHVREIWLGPDGGRLRTSTGRPLLPSRRDRLGWVAAGRPKLRAGTSETDEIPPHPASDLPADPDALFARLEEASAGHSRGTSTEMFTLVADAFRGAIVSPAQRAALYEVVARIPGVELVGSVRDSVGRSGMAVAIDDNSGRTTHRLVIDPRTGTMLEEQEVVRRGNVHGYPEGTVIGHSTYVVTAMVRSVGARPS
jgi:hypothetical protein